MAASDTQTGPVAQTGPIADDLKAIHVLNRLSLGPVPGDLDRVKRIGVPRYIHEQLNPDTIPEPDSLARELARLETTSMSPIALYLKYQTPLNQARKSFVQDRGMSGADPVAAIEADPDVRAAQKRRKTVALQAMEARLMRALESGRQLQEIMTDFWFNHFNVFAAKGPDLIWTGAYEQQAIAPNTLGRFRDLLAATAKHPAMLVYLDNWQNTAPGSPGARGKQEGINENYARELMELHTLGVDGGYTQADVIALARILTGWGLPRPGMNRQGRPGWRRLGRLRSFEYSQSAPWTGDGFLFDASRHDFGEKNFLGHTIGGSGISEGEQALDILAANPATARHLSFKLAQYFVDDQPPDSLVKKLAARWLETGGEIRAVLAALFDSGEFWQKRYFGAKFKTPYQYVLSSVRAAGVRVRNFRPLLGAVARLGMPLYMCPTPDGYKNTQDAWLNPDAMMRRLDFAAALGAGRLALQAPPPGDIGGLDMGGLKRVSAAAAPEPADAVIMAATLGGHFGEQTTLAMEAAPDQLRGAVILGSPEFMRR